jgi:hypothetical protein
MAKPRSIGLTAAALMACAPGAALAGVGTPTKCAATIICQTVTTTISAGATSGTQAFDGFTNPAVQALLPAGASLTDVEDFLNGSATVSATESAGISGSYTFTLLDTVSKVLNSTDKFSALALSTTGSFTLSAGGSSSVALAGTGSGSTALADLSNYLSNFTATASDLGSVTFGGPTGGTATSQSASVVTDKLEYSFSTRSSPIPEPATMTLLGSGLVGIGLARLRRRRRKN